MYVKRNASGVLPPPFVRCVTKATYALSSGPLRGVIQKTSGAECNVGHRHTAPSMMALKFKAVWSHHPPQACMISQQRYPTCRLQLVRPPFWAHLWRQTWLSNQSWKCNQVAFATNPWRFQTPPRVRTWCPPNGHIPARSALLTPSGACTTCKPRVHPLVRLVYTNNVVSE